MCSRFDLRLKKEYNSLAVRNYEVEIFPDGAIPFERFVQKLGGKIRKGSSTEEEEEPVAVWHRRLAHARQLVAQLTEQHDSRQQQGVHRGLQILINSSYPLHDHRIVREDLDYEALTSLLASTLARLFLQADDIPQGVQISRTAENAVHFVSAKRNVFLPQDITFFIERFGLVDGELKSVVDIAMMHNASPNSIRPRISSVSRHVLHKPDTRQLILVHP